MNGYISYEQWATVNSALNDAQAKNKSLIEQLETITKERNKYRSQAIMRQNKIESLLNDNT